MKGTFLSSQTRAICRLLDQYGIDYKQELLKAGLNPQQLDSPRSRFSYKNAAVFWNKLPQLTNNDAIGLEVGQYWRATDAHALGYSMIASKNLSDALNRFARYSSIINDIIKHKVNSSTQGYSIESTYPDSNPPSMNRIIQDMRWSTVLAMYQRCLSHQAYPVKVQFSYDTPDDITPYTSFFQGEVEFNAGTERILFSKADAELEFTTENSELAEINDCYLDDIIENLNQDHLLDRVKKAIIDRLASGTPSAEYVANDLSLTPRTLNRRLHKLDTNFSHVLKNVRAELAFKYINDSQLPITEVSYLLGFSDTSSFSRAFKSWTGEQAYTVRHKNGDLHS